MSALRGQGVAVLVHGSWHGSWCWERVAPLLRELGVRALAVELPSVGTDPSRLADLSGDAASVRSVLDAAGGPVLLVGHSYGGGVITAAAAGHSAVKRLVYLCAFVPDRGESVVDLVGGAPPPWFEAREDGTAFPNLELAPEVFYGDCDPQTQAWATALLRPQSLAANMEKLSVAAWRDHPATYVVCTDDHAIPVEWQRGFAERTGEVLELPTSHSPFLSQPQAVVDLIVARLP